MRSEVDSSTCWTSELGDCRTHVVLAADSCFTAPVHMCVCVYVCADVDVVLMQNPFEMSMSRDVEGDVIAQLDPGNV